MSFDWAEYLQLASALCATPVSPASQEPKERSAISRAYYAAFGKARSHLREVDKDANVPKGPQVHQYVRRAFKEHPNRVRRRIGENLNRLRLQRNRADYDDQVPNLTAASRQSLEWGRRVIDDLATL